MAGGLTGIPYHIETLKNCPRFANIIKKRSSNTSILLKEYYTVCKRCSDHQRIIVDHYFLCCGHCLYVSSKPYKIYHNVDE